MDGVLSLNAARPSCSVEKSEETFEENGGERLEYISSSPLVLCKVFFRMRSFLLNLTAHPFQASYDEVSPVLEEAQVYRIGIILATQPEREKKRLL